MKKSVEYYMSLPYTKEIIKYPDGGFFVKVKELPGCMTEADTKEEAFEMIEDAMRAWIEVGLESGDEIPLPDAVNNASYSGKILLRLPKSLHKELVEKAKKDNVSLNTYLVKLISERNILKKVMDLMENYSSGSDVDFYGTYTKDLDLQNENKNTVYPSFKRRMA